MFRKVLHTRRDRTRRGPAGRPRTRTGGRRAAPDRGSVRAPREQAVCPRAWPARRHRKALDAWRTPMPAAGVGAAAAQAGAGRGGRPPTECKRWSHAHGRRGGPSGPRRVAKVGTCHLIGRVAMRIRDMSARSPLLTNYRRFAGRTSRPRPDARYDARRPRCPKRG